MAIKYEYPHGSKRHAVFVATSKYGAVTACRCGGDKYLQAYIPSTYIPRVHRYLNNNNNSGGGTEVDVYL